jgi:hypothetical protein
MKTKYINLSFEKPLKVSRELSKRALKRYKSVDLNEVNIKERYTFFIPKMNEEKGFFFLQSYNGFLDLTDRFYLVHYGKRNLKDFKVCLHESFYNRIVEVVIFEHEYKTLYGILFKNKIYYEPDTALYSDKFLDVIGAIFRYKPNKYYKLKRLKEGKIQIDKCKHENKILKIDLKKVYYFWCLCVGSNQEQVLLINKYNKKFLKEFYIYKYFVVSEIKNNQYEQA